MKSPLISRRTVLHGLGTALALPLLDAMLPAASRAADKPGSSRPPAREGFPQINTDSAVIYSVMCANLRNLRTI